MRTRQSKGLATRTARKLPRARAKGGTRSEGAVGDVKGRSGKGHDPKSKTEDLQQVVAFVRIAFAAEFSLRKGGYEHLVIKS
jgi:hypothetical protein